MAGVIGPSSKLPGQTLIYRPDGQQCDECENEAKHLVVGETDSFGSETMHLCSKCFLQLQQALQATKEAQAYCEVCGELKVDCEPCRDPSEGTAGPVYQCCPACRIKLVADFIGDDRHDDLDDGFDDDYFDVDEDDY